MARLKTLVHERKIVTEPGNGTNPQKAPGGQPDVVPRTNAATTSGPGARRVCQSYCFPGEDADSEDHNKDPRGYVEAPPITDGMSGLRPVHLVPPARPFCLFVLDRIMLRHN